MSSIKVNRGDMIEEFLKSSKQLARDNWEIYQVYMNKYHEVLTGIGSYQELLIVVNNYLTNSASLNTQLSAMCNLLTDDFVAIHQHPHQPIYIYDDWYGGFWLQPGIFNLIEKDFPDLGGKYLCIPLGGLFENTTVITSHGTVYVPKLS